MKTLIPFFLMLSICAEPCSADFVIVQRVEGAMQSGTMTVKFKGSKSRADVAPQLSTITDGETGDVITLMHQQRTFMKIPADRSRALLEHKQKLAAKSAQSTPAVPLKLTPTGKTEKIQEYECDLYTWSSDVLSATYWVAKDYPNYPAIRAAMESNLNSGLAVLARNMAPQAGDFPGMVMKTEMSMAGQKITTTLVSVTEENLDPKLFAVPPGYKETPTPEFNFSRN